MVDEVVKQDCVTVAEVMPCTSVVSKVVDVSTDAEMPGMDGGAVAEASSKVSIQQSGMSCVMVAVILVI